MASKTICDGCGASEGDMSSRGIVKKRDYCPDCVQVVSHFLDERDALHTELVRSWEAGISELRNKYANDHPTMSFPDE